MVADRAARDARIRRLRAAGWTLSEIAREVGLSRVRVHQILREPDVDAALDEYERALAEEHRVLVEALAAGRVRLRAIEAALRRIAEERESRRIDRLLGLS